MGLVSDRVDHKAVAEVARIRAAPAVRAAVTLELTTAAATPLVNDVNGVPKVSLIPLVFP